MPSRSRAEEAPPCLLVFTRDLRIHDNPALAAAVASGRPIVPAFVDDDVIRNGLPRRAERDIFLEASLADLDASLRRLGAGLVRRRGDWSREVLKLATASSATSIHVLRDVTPYAGRRLARLSDLAGGRIALELHDGATVVPPGSLEPSGSGSHTAGATTASYQVFTPYYRRWAATPWRPLHGAPRRIRTVPWVREEAVTAAPHTASIRGGERAARGRLNVWVARGLVDYAEHRDRLDTDGSSRLSTDLHFGCLSPLEVAMRTRSQAAYVRQLCWRDFFMQAVAARPDTLWHSFVERATWRPRAAPARLAAWCEGRTGYPLVDAGMRQLASEGFLPNRVRMVVASVMTKQLGLDWRDGARYFLEHLVDADVVLNNFNWQWTGGTGTGTHPGRALSPLRQGRRFDPEGDYVRRHVPELAGVPASRVHEPSAEDRTRTGYPSAV